MRWPVDAGPMWSGVPELTVVELVVQTLTRRPDDVALAFEDGVEISRGALLRAIRSFAAYLDNRIDPGDRVAVAMGNRTEFFVAWFGVVAAGGVVVQMNPGAGPHDARHVLLDSGARLIVADEAAASRLRDVATGCDSVEDVLVVDGSRAEPHGLDAWAGARDWEFPAAGAGPAEPASIYYTSGTTGAPKGCVSSQSALIRYVDLVVRLYRPTDRDRFFNPLQFFYGDAIWLFLTALQVDTRMVSLRRFSVSRFWPVVRDSGATVLLGIGSIPNLLLTAEPSDVERQHAVRLALQIGVPAQQHDALIERFGFPWIELYGQAESGLSIGMPMEDAERYVGSGAIGIPFPEVQVRLVDPSGDDVLGAGSGELLVLAPHMMREYLGRPEATAEALTADGWLRTGDRVRRDRDGVHYFLGRTKELIRRGGENIAPFEVESVLRLHPQVVDAAVVPVADPLRGEEVKAYIEVAPASEVDPGEVVAFCRQHLARHKVPRFVEVRREPFPRTPSHRIRKTELQVDGAHRTEQAWDGEAEG